MLFGPLLGQFESQFGFLLRQRQPFLRGKGVGGSLTLLSLEPQVGGKVGGLEGAEGVTPKSIPLGHKPGIFCREKGKQIGYFYPFPLFSTEPV